MQPRHSCGAVSKKKKVKLIGADLRARPGRPLGMIQRMQRSVVTVPSIRHDHGNAWTFMNENEEIILAQSNNTF